MLQVTGQLTTGFVTVEAAESERRVRQE
jgi:hypothetical protein